MVILIIIIAAVVVLGIALAVIYNSLQSLSIKADEAWSDITVQLKRRYDLIPNLVNTVKGYATHEKTVFAQVTEARSNAMQAKGVPQTAKAEGEFAQTLKSLFAVAEAYPELEASDNFKALQDELVDTEDKIQASRRFYNGVVRDFNTRRTTVPTNLVASMFGFKQDREFFELADEERATVEKPVGVTF